MGVDQWQMGVETDKLQGMKKVKTRVHSQVLRIREEESHLGEDYANNGCGGFNINVVLLTRPILPCSPLSGKSTASASATTIQALH